MIARHARIASDRDSGAISFSRRLPVGAELLPEGGVHFRVWAPASKRVAVEFSSASDFSARNCETFDLEPEESGYFSGSAGAAGTGTFYKFRLDSGSFPDPASRFQPEGVHEPSRVIDPNRFEWSDDEWKGAGREGQVIYEMHIGTFTSGGTWRSAMEQLPELANLGVTLLEVMPVAEFPGRFGWGYDGVDLFAPTHLYGTPDDFRAFVDRAHGLGLGVILDVVYNHFGPDGNYLKEFSPDYFTHRYENEWGDAINFDGPNSRPVRELFIANAGYWIGEFHLDGLRLDATQQIFDSSRRNIMAEITARVRKAAGDRLTFVVAENETQETKLARPQSEGGFGMDALWNDDFHHSAIVALTGQQEAYYTDYQGSPQEFISAAKHGYLFQGQWYSWQKQRRGTSTRGMHPAQFVTFIQNHDQVANSLHGFRIHQLTSPGRYRAMIALVLLGPGTPMLFQGQEFAASTPFLYFADHHPELTKLVAQGRRKFLAQFHSIARMNEDEFVCDPASEENFTRCKLDFSEREKHVAYYRLHRDLLKLRRENPVFSKPRPGGVEGAVLGDEAFVLRFFDEGNSDRLLLVNFGRDLHLSPAPEPLLAQSEDRQWTTLWSSEDTAYGGCGATPLDTEENWHLPGHAAVVLMPGPNQKRKHGKADSQNRSGAGQR